jgi:hypothetical protein
MLLQEEPSSGDANNAPVLKVWALDKPVKKTGIPTCLSTVAINNGKKPFPVRAVLIIRGAGLMSQTDLRVHSDRGPLAGGCRIC